LTELDSLRDEIRGIDAEILQLVQRRDQAAKRIGTLKRKKDLPLQNFEVEKAVLENALADAARLGIHEETARGLVKVLIHSALRAQERDPAHRRPKSGRTALVVGGAGLMGEWFARFLEEDGYDVFVDDPMPSAFPRGKVGDRAYDLILVATPPSTLATVLDDVGTAVDARTLVVDIGSVKGKAAATLRRLAKAGKRVASLHPMFGPHTDALMGRNVLVLDAGAPEAASAAGELFSRTAARTVPLPLSSHDELMANVLTLAHATSLAFNHALAAGGRSIRELEPVASTTFRKQVDVSREVARENPKLYFEIQALNPASGPVLQRLEDSVNELRARVAAHDERGFESYMAQGRRFYGGTP
jgi:chorismate mutase/prephenate dehydrogenase